MSRLSRAACAWMLPLVCAAAVSACATSTPDLRHLVATSTFVFRGTLIARAATADVAIPADTGTSTVHVDQALICPAGVGDFTGRRVTVRGMLPHDSVMGARRWYFAVGWVLGDHIAVERIASFDVAAPGQRDRILDGVAVLVSPSPLAAFRDHVRASNLAGVVTVTAVERAQGSEHARGWLRITATIDSLIPFGSPADAAQRGTALAYLARHTTDKGPSIAPPQVGEAGVVTLRAISDLPRGVRMDTTANYYSPEYQSLNPPALLGQLGNARPLGWAYLPPIKWCSGAS